MALARMDKLVKRLMSNPAGGYNSTGLPVSLVLNHRSFVQDWKPVARITHVLNMFDVLSNENSRKFRIGFELLTLSAKHVFKNIFHLKINMEMKVLM